MNNEQSSSIVPFPPSTSDVREERWQCLTCFPIYEEELNEWISKELFGEQAPPDGTDVEIFTDGENWQIGWEIQAEGHMSFPDWVNERRREYDDTRSFNELVESGEWAEFLAAHPSISMRRDITRALAFELCCRSMMPAVFFPDMERCMGRQTA